MTDPYRIADARFVYITGRRFLAYALHRSSHRILIPRDHGIDSDTAIHETIYPDHLRPLVDHWQRVVALYGRGLQALTGVEDDDSRVAADCFRRVVESVRDIPGAMPAINLGDSQ